MTIAENLAALDKQEIQERNLVNNFLPFRQQRANSPKYDFEAIAGSVLSAALRKELKNNIDLDKFETSVFSRLRKKLTSNEIDALIHKMYFEKDTPGLFKVSPEFLIFKAQDAEISLNKHVSQVLRSLILVDTISFPEIINEVSFLEQELIAQLQESLDQLSLVSSETPYLPFMADCFSKDLLFLIKNPSYFLQNIQLFFSLYTFLYSSQLALNINDWMKKPTSKPLFFILETEKASLERKNVREVFRPLQNNAADLFPILSMLKYLNQLQNKKAIKAPLWQVYEYIEGMNEHEKQSVHDALTKFCGRYREKRGLDEITNYPDTTESIFKLLTSTAKNIFSQRGTGQFTVNSKFVNAFENEIASNFTQNRGRSGRILTIPQDYFLLLTNLSIGNRERVQFQDLLSEFKKRGIWFDRQSEQAIIKFLERIGNIEKMSDSGDAVYVRKTL